MNKSKAIKLPVIKALCTLLCITVIINLNASDLYHTTVNLNFRSGPGSEFKSNGIIKKGERVSLVEKTNTFWFKIEYKGKIGFLYSKYLSPVVNESPKNEPAAKLSNFSFIYFIIVVILVILIIFALSSLKKPIVSTSSKSNYSIKMEEERKATKLPHNPLFTVIRSNVINKYKDDSIIDITEESNQLSSTNELKKYSSGVPYWAHQYVYYYSEIKGATDEQRKFYNIFKNSFLKGVYLDIEGNTNYAFILLFDLLNDYENHKDLPKLEQQLKLLGQFYTKTKSYGINFLIKIMEAKGDSEGVLRLINQDQSSYQNNYIDNDYWKLGNKYKTKLSLKQDEVELLNRLWYPRNNFISIEYCLFQILKLYVDLFEELKAMYLQEGSTLDNEFLYIADLIAKKHFNYRPGSYNYKYCIESTIKEIYLNIFKHCENSLREKYGHKRKINTDLYYSTPEVKEEFETKIISKITEIMPIIISKVTPPDETTEIELYSQNTNRWKIKFDELTINYNDNPKLFMDSIISLSNLNKKNPSIEIIFFEASKFISKYNREAALSLYVYYLYYDLKSVTFDNRQLTKTIQKNLFRTNEQLHDFQIIVSELIKDKNLEKALGGVPKIYAVKRKKIKLDTSSIKEVQQHDSETVELLNEYLNDEYEDDSNILKTQEINNEEATIEITQKIETAQNSNYKKDIAFTQIQTKILDIFAKNNFSVLQSELEAFAKSNGVFKNQLIESINEICYEILDDILIEEEDEFHTINPIYYQNLLTK
jgi:hypothetical protein